MGYLLFMVFDITNLEVDRGWSIPREGDRYSKPTTLYHTDIDRTLATFCDNLQSGRVIVD
jgi:hypothetical protein